MNGAERPGDWFLELYGHKISDDAASICAISLLSAGLADDLIGRIRCDSSRKD